MTPQLTSFLALVAIGCSGATAPEVVEADPDPERERQQCDSEGPSQPEQEWLEEVVDRRLSSVSESLAKSSRALDDSQYERWADEHATAVAAVSKELESKKLGHRSGAEGRKWLTTQCKRHCKTAHCVATCANEVARTIDLRRLSRARQWVFALPRVINKRSCSLSKGLIALIECLGSGKARKATTRAPSFSVHKIEEAPAGQSGNPKFVVAGVRLAQLWTRVELFSGDPLGFRLFTDSSCGHEFWSTELIRWEQQVGQPGKLVPQVYDG